LYQLNCAGAVAVAYVSGAETVGAETAGAEMSQRRNGERRNGERRNGGAETAAPKRPVPRCPSAEKSQRRNGERRNGGAETAAPKRRRRNVLLRNSSESQSLNVNQYQPPSTDCIVVKTCIGDLLVGIVRCHWLPHVDSFYQTFQCIF